MSESNKENRVKLTKRSVESVSPDMSKQVFIWDTEITGFGLRVYPSGRKTYFFQYRNKYNTTKKIKIGVHGNITAELARDSARELAIKVSSGLDPSSESKCLQLSPTIRDLARDYLEIYAAKEKSQKSIANDRSMLKTHILVEFGSRKVAEITSRDIQLLRGKLSSKPVASNRVLALIQKMFNLAIQWGWRSENPVSGVQKFKEYKRTRWLQEDELKKLLDTLDKHPNQKIANIIRFLLLTGARKHEVLEATWEDFDLKRGIWTKKAQKTKQRKMEHLPLSPSALNILSEMKKYSDDSQFVFPGRVPGRPLVDIKKSWETIRRQAGLKDVRIHDLRHTFASHLVSSGLSLNIVGKLLGHTQAITTQRYAHLADEPLREAANLFAQKFDKIKDDKI